MKETYALIVVAILWWATPIYAYVPELVTQPTLHDITAIADPDLSQVFFGELTGMPHTYDVVVDEPLVLSLELRTPETASNTNSISSIVIKVPRKGRVEEVARLIGKDATWIEGEDELTGDTYRTGPSFSKELTPGVYRIEVHTSENAEKYMLAIGTRRDMTLGYTELIERLLQVKDFYETSRLFIVCSPYVYWPLLVILVAVGAFFSGRRFYRNRFVHIDT